MTRDDIIRMAHEAGIVQGSADLLERFAALVAAAEREACAKIADRYADDWLTSQTAKVCAAAIRARGAA